MTNSHTSCLGLVLAGGLSRRMFQAAASGEPAGGDKGLLDLGGQSMIAHVIGALRPQVSGLIVNANGDPARYASLGLPIVADTVGGFVGPLAGVLAGLRWATVHAPPVTHVVSASADAPFLPQDLVVRLWSAAMARPGAIALARSAGELHPVIGLWPVAVADDLEAQLAAGVRKVLRFTDRHGTLPVDFEPQDIGGVAVDPFFNANTPEELDEARRLLALRRP